MRQLLRRIARRCEIHDRAWPSVIRALEADLGLPLTPGTGRLSDDYCAPDLIDCGHDWCRERRGSAVIRHCYGYSPADRGVRPGVPPREAAGASSARYTSADVTIHELPLPPAWMLQWPSAPETDQPH